MEARSSSLAFSDPKHSLFPSYLCPIQKSRAPHSFCKWMLLRTPTPGTIFPAPLGSYMLLASFFRLLKILTLSSYL